MVSDQASAVRQLATWVAEFDCNAVPDAVLDVARDCIVDTLGVALAGMQTQVAGLARETTEMHARGKATILGRAERFSAPGAAFVNAATAHALDFDDNCNAGFVHGSAVLVPAALAAAEWVDATGNAFLSAFVAGAEVEYAIGKGAGSRLYEKGWWTTGALGPAGAAAATARLLGLDADRTAAALGIAIAGTGGVKACFGTDAKPLLCGRAAEAGVTAALLASHGASGPVALLEVERGFANLFNDGFLDAQPFTSLGSEWSLLEPGIDVKRFPVCLSAHTAIDAAMALAAEHRLTPDGIARIVCDVSDLVISNLTHLDPRTPQAAQFSMAFAVACALVHGDVRLEHLEPAVLQSDPVQRLMSSVEMIGSSRWAPGTDIRRRCPEGAFVEITTTGGRCFEVFRDYAPGTRQRPLGRAAIDAKFIDCASRVIADPTALLERLRNVEMLPSARDLFIDTIFAMQCEAP